MLFRGWGESVDGRWPDAATVVDHVGVPHLVVTRHALVRQVLTDPVTFRPDNALDAVTPIPVAALRVLAGHRFRLPPTLANNGGASHPEIRGIVADALHPHRVAAQRQWLTGLVRERVAGLAAELDAGRPVDLYAGLAADLPLLVLARLVELPDAPVGAVKDFARAALELFWAPLDSARQLALAAEVGRFHTVLREFAATGGGLAARLRDAGHSPDVVVGALFFLLVAGQETTSQFLTLLLHRLAGEPAVRAGLRAGTVGGGRRGRGGAAAGTADRHLAAGGGGRTPRSASCRWRRAPAWWRGWPAPAATRPWSARRASSAPGSPARGGTWRSAPGRTAASARSWPGWRRRWWSPRPTALLDGVTVVRPPWCPDNLTFRMPDAFVVRRA